MVHTNNLKISGIIQSIKKQETADGHIYAAVMVQNEIDYNNAPLMGIFNVIVRNHDDIERLLNEPLEGKTIAVAGPVILDYWKMSDKKWGDKDLVNGILKLYADEIYLPEKPKPKPLPDPRIEILDILDNETDFDLF